MSCRRCSTSRSAVRSPRSREFRNGDERMSDPTIIDKLSTPPDGGPHEAQPAWRRDFPIDLGQDAYVARRDFTKFMVLISGAFATGQLWILAQSFLRRRRELPAAREI